jgi:hypothetical protein
MKLEISTTHKREQFTIRRIHDRQDGVVLSKTDGVAEIVFVNDKFSEVTFNAKNPYTRDNWKMLALIERMITHIEKEKSKAEEGGA